MSLAARASELSRMGLAFARLDAAEDRSYPLHVVLITMGQIAPVLIHFFIAKLVDPRPDGSIGGDYFTFAAVGLMIAILIDAVLRSVGTRLQLLQNRGTLEGMLVEPVPWTFFPIAMSTWTSVLALFSSATGLAVAFGLGADFTADRAVAFVVLVLLALGAAMAVGTLSGAVLVMTKRSDPVLRVYSLVSTLVAGAVFPVELLPGPLRALSLLIPHRHAIDAGRQLLMQAPPDDGTSVLGSMLALLAFDVIVLPLGMILFARSLAMARRTGLLWTY